jgi:hypothetical protein
MAEWLKAAVLKRRSGPFCKLNKINEILLPVKGWIAFLLLAATLPAQNVPVISPGGILNAASYNLASTSVAPGSIATIFGTNLSNGTVCVTPCGPSFDKSGVPARNSHTHHELLDNEGNTGLLFALDPIKASPDRGPRQEDVGRIGDPVASKSSGPPRSIVPATALVPVEAESALRAILGLRNDPKMTR